jgi:hypothetical protein
MYIYPGTPPCGLLSAGLVPSAGSITKNFPVCNRISASSCEHDVTWVYAMAAHQSALCRCTFAAQFYLVSQISLFPVALYQVDVLLQHGSVQYLRLVIFAMALHHHGAYSMAQEFSVVQ